MASLAFSARTVADLAGSSSDCIVVPVFNGETSTGALRQLDDVTGGAVKGALGLGDFKGKRGQTLLLTGARKVKRILLVGCGESSDFSRAAMRALCSDIYAGLHKTGAKNVLLTLAPLALAEEDTRFLLAYFAQSLTTAAYRYTETVSKPKPPLKATRFTVDPGSSVSARAGGKALREGLATGTGINDAKELANLPGNICTPTYLASAARKLSRRYTDMSVSIVEEKAMKELGMHSLLSVSAGSRQPAKLIVMNYKGGKKSQQPHVLVGKGITFDSGGVSLKPGAKMDEMKFDMAGAASVFGTMRAIAEQELPLNVVAIIPAAENMPDGLATKPGDVVTSMAGKTIEILNTDAEGRLVLCDALTYAARFKPASVIDVATLTGACVVALGSHASALYANDDTLADLLLEAGTATHDRAWRMPLWDDYQKQLNSNFADMANIGGPGGGSITAACFLARFAEDYTWAHLDIAGSAWNSAPKGATGRPVGLLTRYLQVMAGRAG